MVKADRQPKEDTTDFRSVSSLITLTSHSKSQPNKQTYVMTVINCNNIGFTV